MLAAVVVAGAGAGESVGVAAATGSAIDAPPISVEAKMAATNLIVFVMIGKPLNVPTLLDCGGV